MDLQALQPSSFLLQTKEMKHWEEPSSYCKSQQIQVRDSLKEASREEERASLSRVFDKGDGSKFVL